MHNVGPGRAGVKGNPARVQPGEGLTWAGSSLGWSGSRPSPDNGALE